MSRHESIKAQLKRATEILPKIEGEYINSLHRKDITNDLKLDIQTFLGHLRAILDYLSKDIVEKYCPTAVGREKVKFPINDDALSFKKNLARFYPNLITNCFGLYNFLESVQPYFKSENKWLAQFNKVNNLNKHDNLTEQVKVEKKQLNISSAGASMILGQESSVYLGDGAIMKIGNLEIPGGQIFNANNPPKVLGEGKQEVTRWVDFKFIDTDVSALWLLEESLRQVTLIIVSAGKYL